MEHFKIKNVAILSDLHGNLPALQAVLRDLRRFEIDGVILLGDLIDYGMQSNEVIRCLWEDLRYPELCGIWGNHERAILLGDYTRFSSPRGVESAKHTAKMLGEAEKTYLETRMCREGLREFLIAGKKCLAVHGSLEDPFWGSIFPENVHGDYSGYDIVFSGHSHYSHMFTRFYPADDPATRNKHAVLFINPGSVGQPRNHHPEAQYAMLEMDTLSVTLRAVPYDIESAQALFDGSVDDFYRIRLANGI